MSIVGLDIGGSKTHAVAEVCGRVLEATAGSANLSSVGDAEAARQLDAVFAALARQGLGPVEAVCAGAAGVHTPEAEARLRRLLDDRAPGAAVRIVHDTQLILAAAGVDTGIAVIAGTGSVAYGRDAAGRMARAGGWGYLLGDEGSGYGIARDAVRHALSVADGGAAPDRLTTALAESCGLTHPDQLLDHFYAVTERRYWAGQARLVFELAADGDPAALSVVGGAAAALAGVVRTVDATLGGLRPCPVVLAGGVLVHQPALVEALRPLLAADGLHDLRVLDTDPARGALRLAAQEAGAGALRDPHDL